VADNDGQCSVTGEKEETVEGILSQESATGNPDIVVRMGPQNKLVVMIVEVSVDSNGGEKKAGQAFDYASMIDKPNETILLLTLNFDRKLKGCDLKITQEAFLHSDDEAKRKLGFLWREVYAANDLQSPDSSTALKSACEGIVRCLDCAKYLDTLKTTSVKWDVVSDNAAIENDESVYKIFDNRFHPTYRKPDAWLRSDPWITPLNVDSDFLLFQESDSVDKLGHPTKKGERGDDNSPPKTVAYPRGSVRIIKYKFVNGTHFASKVSHFLQIAKCIEDMHKAGIIHGDVRGFNMLHPHPKFVVGQIEMSLLIDFDLCGSPGDKYPPGYSERVIENQFDRCGSKEENMMMYHDWYELASAMSSYSVGVRGDSLQKAWSELCSHALKMTEPSTDAEDFARLIHQFIKEHGDANIWLLELVEDAWNLAIRGTGSPNKEKQRSRGSTTLAS
jgi:hypothetical protein